MTARDWLVPHSRPRLVPEDSEAVLRSLASPFLSGGVEVSRFEAQFAELIGTDDAIAVNSCASALLLALRANDISGEVIVPSFTWAATANAVVLAGATPVFADVDMVTAGMTSSTVGAAISSRTEAVVAVHLSGIACGIEGIARLAHEHGLLLVEDCAQSCGSRVGDRRLGSFGVGCFSFYPTKVLTTGEGGMVTTSDARLAKRLRSLRGHGVEGLAGHPWERGALEPGYNFRMPSPLAALGAAQLGRLKSTLEMRRQVGLHYDRLLGEVEGVGPFDRPDGSIYGSYPVVLPAADRDRVVLGLRRCGVEATVHYSPPVHRQPAFSTCLAKAPLMATEELAARVATLPLFADMSRDQTELVAETLRDAMDDRSGA